MKNSHKILSIAVVASLMLMSKCGKDRPKVDDETQSIEDNVTSEQEFMRIVPTTNDKAIKQKGIGSAGRVLSDDDMDVKFEIWASANISNTNIIYGWNDIGGIDDDDFEEITDKINNVLYYKSSIDTVRITIEYDANETQDDGSKKSGKVITYIKKQNGNPIKLFGNDGGKSTTKLVNFKLNNEIEYNGSIDLDRITQTVMEMKVNNGTCNKAGSWNSAYSNQGNRKITWLKGANHPSDNKDSSGNPYEFDEYRIEEANPSSSGSSGVSRSGLAYTVKITSPLIFRTNAKYGIVSGIVQLTPDGKKTRTIDYGQINQGIVTFTVDGNSFTINL
jgi:hypothetical protein